MFLFRLVYDLSFQFSFQVADIRLAVIKTSESEMREVISICSFW